MIVHSCKMLGIKKTLNWHNERCVCVVSSSTAQRKLVFSRNSGPVNAHQHFHQWFTIIVAALEVMALSLHQDSLSDDFYLSKWDINSKNEANSFSHVHDDQLQLHHSILGHLATISHPLADCMHSLVTSCECECNASVVGSLHNVMQAGMSKQRLSSFALHDAYPRWVLNQPGWCGHQVLGEASSVIGHIPAVAALCLYLECMDLCLMQLCKQTVHAISHLPAFCGIADLLLLYILSECL